MANFAPVEQHYAAWIESGHEIIDDIEILLANESEDGSTQSEPSVELGVGVQQRRLNRVENQRPLNIDENRAENEVENELNLNNGIMENYK